MILHVVTNNAVDSETHEIVQKLLELKEFVNTKLPNCKVVIYRAIKTADKTKAKDVIDKVAKLLQQLNIEMLNNESIGRKHLGEKGLYLNQLCLKQFAVNLMVGIRES